MAGTSAAICAGRLGARVLLIENMGCLGGLGTSGLVSAFDPMANGVEMLTGGLMREIVEEMYARGFLDPYVNPDAWRKKDHCWTPFNGEGLKLLLDEYAEKAGVEVRYFTRLADADAESGTVRGIIIHNIEGFSYIPSKTFVDGTGDAALSQMCGAVCRQAGRDSPNIMACTMPSVYANVDFDSYFKMGRDIDKWAEMIEEDYHAGLLSQCDRHLPGLSRIGKNIAYLNGGHLYRLDATRCVDLSEGMMNGRKIAQEYLSFYRRRFDGCENAELVQTGAIMGVRESRRILGEYELKREDYFARRHFHDQIGLSNKHIDIHPYDCSVEEWERFRYEAFGALRPREGESFGIPYGILVPKGFRNLWTAGRCASTDVEVQGSIRVMPTSSMMGQAAGTAAVQSIRTEQAACELDTEELVLSLRRQGANLPQKSLSRKMSRNT